MGSSCKSITRLLSQLPEEQETRKYNTELLYYIILYILLYIIYYIVIQRERELAQIL